jgi:hypothetical protein
VNLDQDPGEMQNAAADHPDVLERLEQRHTDWMSFLRSEGKPGE